MHSFESPNLSKLVPKCRFDSVNSTPALFTEIDAADLLRRQNSWCLIDQDDLHVPFL
jgi:hypothetical protein